MYCTTTHGHHFAHLRPLKGIALTTQKEWCCFRTIKIIHQKQNQKSNCQSLSECKYYMYLDHASYGVIRINA